MTDRGKTDPGSQGLPDGRTRSVETAVAIPENPAKLLRRCLWALCLNRRERPVSLGTMNLNALLSELPLCFRIEIWTVKRMAVGGHRRELMGSVAARTGSPLEPKSPASAYVADRGRPWPWVLGDGLRAQRLETLPVVPGRP